MKDVQSGLEYYSTIASKYHIKPALVTWIVRKFKANPTLIDEIELKALRSSVMKWKVEKVVGQCIAANEDIWNIN